MFKKFLLVLSCTALLLSAPACQKSGYKHKQGKVKRGKPMPCPIKDC